MAWETVFIDGFDHYTTSEIGKKWSAAGGNAIIDGSVFRNSGKSVRGGGSDTVVSAKRLPASVKNILVGFGLRLSAAPAAAALSNAYASLLLFGNTVDGFSDQCGIALLSDSKLHAFRGSNSAVGGGVTGTDLGASTNTVSVAQWAYVEVRVFVHDTDGQIEVRLNGTVEINLTGVDTRNSSTLDSVSAFALRHCTGLSNTTNFDDLYVRTSSSSTAESGGFLGDIRIKPLYPDADGTYSQMTPSTGTTHYTLVDETTPGTTDYVSSSTAGHKETYSFENFSDSGSVKAVQLNVYAAKDDAGFRGLDLMTKSGATENFDSSQPLSVTVAYKTKVWEKNPNTSNDWSQSEVNAAEFGARISADI